MFTTGAFPIFQKLSSDRRLHHPWQYRAFFDQSQVFKYSECIIFRVRNDLSHFRLGITLKARGSSPERNKVKRQIREAFRTHQNVLGSFDYNVVIPSGKRMAHPYPALLERCLRDRFVSAVARSNS